MDRITVSRQTASCVAGVGTARGWVRFVQRHESHPIAPSVFSIHQRENLDTVPPVQRSHAARIGALLVSVVATVWLIGFPATDSARADTSGAAAAARGHHAARCARLKAQPFLIRSNYLAGASMSAGEVQRRVRMHNRALQYRAEKYGTLDGIGPQSANPHPVTFYLEQTTFMGLALQIHRRIVPALRCAEADLRRSCGATPYQPKAVGGYRDYNSYRHGEVTNHLFGIAIDIDPDLNPCCGCVDPWPDNPRCKMSARSAFDRMAMPQCWVRTFERHGFYWLGHDQLQDMMHFEFLGNPDRLGR
jgi:hypothetical protein